MKVQIIKSAPLPAPTRGKRQSQYPFEELEVGDMFFVPYREKNNLKNRATQLGKKLNRKFVTRVLWMVDTPKGWMPDTEAQGQLVQGIGVWRIS